MKRKSYSAEFKAKVALELVKGNRTVNEIATEYDVHPTMIAKWKRELLDRIPEIFSTKQEKKDKKQEELVASLYQQIGQLKVEVDWLQKKSVMLR